MTEGADRNQWEHTSAIVCAALKTPGKCPSDYNPWHLRDKQPVQRRGNVTDVLRAFLSPRPAPHGH